MAKKKKKRIAVWVDEDIYEDFRAAIKPLKITDAIRSYVRVVISSRQMTLIDVIDKGLEEFIKKNQ